MSMLIRGEFRREEQANHALADLRAAGLSADFTTPSPVEGPTDARDREHEGGQGQPAADDPAVGGAMSGALIGSAVGTTVGLVTLPVLGPAAVVAGVGVGAYVGSLYGALNQLGEVEPPNAGAHPDPIESSQDHPRQISVSTPDITEQQTAIRIMREHGATGVNRAEGAMLDGRWIDSPP